jgi:hypothetical protein
MSGVRIPTQIQTACLLTQARVGSPGAILQPPVSDSTLKCTPHKQWVLIPPPECQDIHLRRDMHLRPLECRAIHPRLPERQVILLPLVDIPHLRGTHLLLPLSLVDTPQVNNRAPMGERIMLLPLLCQFKPKR